VRKAPGAHRTLFISRGLATRLASGGRHAESKIQFKIQVKIQEKQFEEKETE
jgi:hypothetical protein